MEVLQSEPKGNNALRPDKYRLLLALIVLVSIGGCKTTLPGSDPNGSDFLAPETEETKAVSVKKTVSDESKMKAKKLKKKGNPTKTR